MQDPKNIPAVDLDAVARGQRLDKAARDANAMAEATVRAEAWDKAMRRTFKGIMPRKTAHRFLMSAAKQRGLR